MGMIMGISDEFIAESSDNELIEFCTMLNKLGKQMLENYLKQPDADKRLKLIYEKVKDKSATEGIYQWIKSGCPLVTLTDEIISYIKDDEYLSKNYEVRVPRCLDGNPDFNKIKFMFINTNYKESSLKNYFKYNIGIFRLMKDGIDFLEKNRNQASSVSYWRQL